MEKFVSYQNGCWWTKRVTEGNGKQYTGPLQYFTDFLAKGFPPFKLTISHTVNE